MLLLCGWGAGAAGGCVSCVWVRGVSLVRLCLEASPSRALAPRAPKGGAVTHCTGLVQMGLNLQGLAPTRPFGDHKKANSDGETEGGENGGGAGQKK